MWKNLAWLLCVSYCFAGIWREVGFLPKTVVRDCATGVCRSCVVGKNILGNPSYLFGCYLHIFIHMWWQVWACMCSCSHLYFACALFMSGCFCFLFCFLLNSLLSHVKSCLPFLMCWQPCAWTSAVESISWQWSHLTVCFGYWSFLTTWMHWESANVVEILLAPVSITSPSYLSSGFVWEAVDNTASKVILIVAFAHNQSIVAWALGCGHCSYLAIILGRLCFDESRIWLLCNAVLVIVLNIFSHPGQVFNLLCAPVYVPCFFMLVFCFLTLQHALADHWTP